ncbi:hypothetical protein GGF46_004957 [Coemansia sp. RSA 552]|nr:hypothetical protein GGF46_004957 [Coemansia sp. RSA 552]
MVPLDAPDSTPLLMVYGGTDKADGNDPLDAAGDGVDTLRLYDTSDGKWYKPDTAKAPASGPILPGCGAASDSAWVYDPQYATPNKASTTVSLLDTAHWSWSSPSQNGQLPVTRFGAAFAYVPDNQGFYMHGGIPLATKENVADDPPGIANNLDILSPSNLRWSYASNGPARKYHTLCYMKSIDSLVMFGGSDQNIASYGDVKVFSVEKNTWKYDVDVNGTAPAERLLHSAVCTDDTMYVFGGVHSINDTPSDSAVWVLAANDDSRFTWSRAPVADRKNGPTARAGHAAAISGENMYIFGGVGASAQDDALYKLDLRSYEWTNLLADGAGSRSGPSTGVIVAAVVASILGLAAIFAATFVFYRWNRHRNALEEQQGSSDCDDSSPEGKDLANFGQADTSTAAGAGTYHVGGTDGYLRQYEDHSDIYGIHRDVTMRRGTASDVVANDYLPPQHANPSLGSAVASIGPSNHLQGQRHSTGGDINGYSHSPVPQLPHEPVDTAQILRQQSRSLDLESRAPKGDGASNDTHSVLTCEPIRYMGSMQGRREHESDLSEADSGSFSVPDGFPLGVEPPVNLTQPMAPPIPPHMSFLYGELQNNGIVVGQTGIPEMPAANGMSTSNSVREDNILSPLDRLAQYHSLGSWDPPLRETEEPGNRSSTYAARSTRRSADSD